jgi:hypothetical protein
MIAFWVWWVFYTLRNVHRFGERAVENPQRFPSAVSASRSMCPVKDVGGEVLQRRW